MKKKLLSGILFSSAGSFWWGVIAVFYFKHVSFAGTLEIVVHRTIWTAFVLFLTIMFYSRWDFFFEIYLWKPFKSVSIFHIFERKLFPLWLQIKNFRLRRDGYGSLHETFTTYNGNACIN